MPELSHPVFGSVGRSERPETPIVQAPVEQEITPKQETPMISDDLRSLIECGKITDTIIVDGKKFQMSTLADEEQEALVKKFSVTLVDVGSFIELRRTVVAMSVNTVNDKPLESLYPITADQTDIFGAKLAIIRKMQGQVIEKLYAFYEELLKRSKQKVESEQVKN